MQLYSDEEMITKYMLGSTDAASTLCVKELYGFAMIIMFSAIDTLGLLNAPTGQVSANRSSFKSWVETFLLPHTDGKFNADDLYAARCGLVHSFTAESDLSRGAKARQLHYMVINEMDDATKQAIKIIETMDGGAHVTVDLKKFTKSFSDAMADFFPIAVAGCADPAYQKRVQAVMQLYPISLTP